MTTVTLKEERRRKKGAGKTSCERCSWQNSNTEKGQLKGGVGSEKGASKALVIVGSP